MKKKRRICFVDDEQDELDRVKAALKGNFRIGVGTSPEKAEEDLGGNPQLFLLDMYYGPETDNSKRKDVADAWRELHKSQVNFYTALRRSGQEVQGGLNLAKHVKREYPRVPFAFFTRKASLEDANRGFEAGAVAVLKKPDPDVQADDQSDSRTLAGDEREQAAQYKAASDRAMAEYSEQLYLKLSSIIDQRTWWARYRGALLAFLSGVVVSVLGGLVVWAIQEWRS